MAKVRSRVESTPSLSLRPISPADAAFLYQVYASTRLEELAPLGWDEAQQEAFLKMQFKAQHTYYMAHYAQADFQIILLGGEPIGRLYVERHPDEIRLIDIALLPPYRHQGIGSALLRDILTEGERCQRPVRLHVERFNPALRLYTRLGFRPIGDNGVYYSMEWSPLGRQEDAHAE